jgi:hypothetical protein
MNGSLEKIERIQIVALDSDLQVKQNEKVIVISLGISTTNKIWRRQRMKSYLCHHIGIHRTCKEVLGG